MNPFLRWLESRWRTRDEYAWRGRRLLVRFGGRTIITLVPILLVLFGLWWMLSSPSRSGARAVRLDRLADSIVAAVERGDADRLVTLQDYVAAGVLTADDLEFLDDQGVTFHPITRSSPDTAVVFRRAGRGTERVHRKDGSEDYYAASASPDGRFSVVVGPPPRGPQGRPDPDKRSVTVRSLEGGHAVGSFLVPHHASVQWSPDSRFVAVTAGLEHPWRVASRETFVLAVGPAGVRRLELPREVDPEALLAPEDRAARLQSTDVRPLAWRGSRLDVESTGQGWLGKPGASGSSSIAIRCRFVLEVSDAGVREVEREMTTYAKRPRP